MNKEKIYEVLLDLQEKIGKVSLQNEKNANKISSYEKRKVCACCNWIIAGVIIMTIMLFAIFGSLNTISEILSK